ncbi:hypothetical protein BYT27DRAFT_7200985 [Phlegmacium glaucopus]|nr:hypothetical protein BYT27DRAFT_7200985 [Phlegmacium glaucopus]
MASNSTSLDDPSDLRTVATSLIVALAINWGLLGMLCLQVYTYYIAFPQDHLLPKLQVYGVLFCECVQSAVVAYDVVTALVKSLGDPNELDLLRTLWFTIPVAGGITGGVGQLFFAYRIWMISSELKPTIIIAAFSVASVCSAMFSAEAFFRAKTFSILLSGDMGFPSIAAWNGIGAICDLSIALSMPYFLMRHGTGLRSTHIMIVRLVRLLIEIGGLTAIMAILHLCLYSSRNEIFVIPGLSMSKLYATTMLVILNNRLKIEGGRFEQGDVEESTLSSQGERRNSRTTKILVSNGRLTFQLADVPAMPNSRNTSTAHDSVVDLNAQAKVELENP